MSSVDLFDHRANIYSQNGEDGIVAKLLGVGGIETGVFLEFGAWDGIHLSNTHALYQRGLSGCLMAGDVRRFADLWQNTPDERVIRVNAFVAPEGEQSLDGIAQRLAILPTKPSFRQSQAF